MEKRHLPGTIEKRFSASIEAAAADGYDATGILSATKEDRVGDTIALDAYKPWIGKRLPALFAHDHEKIIGSWENIRVKGEQLIGDLKLAGTNVGLMVRELIKSNVPLMNSIGFRGKGKPREGQRGIHFSEIELLEASVVAIGAHPDAYMIAKQFNISLPVATQEDMAASGLTRDPAKVITQAKAAILRANKTIRNSHV